MTRNHDGTFTLRRRDIVILGVCFGFLGSAVTIGAAGQSVLSRLTRVEKDLQTLVCAVVPTDLRCRQ